jgi:tRNA (cmo5U34)-methyltransferase
MTTRSEPEHRMAPHVGVDAAAYDTEIRRFIPGYEEMIGEVASILDDSLGEEVRVVDLGTGTGALAGMILDRVPRARVVLVDIDPHMLEVASARVAPHGDRVEQRRATFEDALVALAAEPVGGKVGAGIGAVVGSLSLHHVQEVDRKRALYARIFASLAPGGVFLCADATVHEAGAEHARIYRQWMAGMALAGLAAAEAEALFAQWAGEDRYYPLAVELDLLAAAGFVRPDCFWKRGAMTVFGGFR